VSDPSYALQVAIFDALKADATLAGFIGARVYDSVPEGAAFPYVTVGDGQVVGDDNECADGSEVFFQCHAWSRATGYPEVKKIAAALRSALRSATLTLAGFDVGLVEFTQTQFLKDPDGLTSHAVVEFRFLITHG
jgi:hypothetical protein